MTRHAIGTPEQLRDPNYMPPLYRAIPLGVQHVLAMFVSNVTPAIIVCGAAGFGTTISCEREGPGGRKRIVRLGHISTFEPLAELFVVSYDVGANPAGRTRRNAPALRTRRSTQ